MNTHKAILCVGIPTLEEVGRFGLGFSDSLGFLETCALLQQKLAGIWNIKYTGEAQKVPLSASWSDAGEVLQIKLETTLSVGELRIHYQYLEENNPRTNIDTSICTFEVVGHPKGYPTKFIIGAKKVGDKFEPTYTFM